MIGMRGTGCARATPSGRFGWRASSSCAALAIACAIVAWTPVFKPSPAQAHFNVGGFQFHLDRRHDLQLARWRHRHHRWSRRYRGGDDDTPDPERETGTPSPRPATTGVAPDPGPRVSSGRSEGRPASGRPEPRGPDLEPAK
jgi:hypothetical protein